MFETIKRECIYIAEYVPKYRSCIFRSWETVRNSCKTLRVTILFSIDPATIFVASVLIHFQLQNRFQQIFKFLVQISM